MKRLAVGFMFVIGLMASPAVAHEGHSHRVMGTVSAVHGQELEVQATTGKTALVVVNAKTKIVRGETAETVAGIKSGDRVVVTGTESKDASGRERLTATEVKVGRSADAPRK